MLAFGTAGAVTVDELAKGSWMPAADSVPSCEIPATITFAKNGTFTSEPGCNSMKGEYKLGEDGSITFSNMGLTRKLCAKQYMDLEKSFLEILNKARYIEKDGKYLKLFDADKKPAGVLEPEISGSCS